jgi:hypothetical protein
MRGFSGVKAVRDDGVAIRGVVVTQSWSRGLGQRARYVAARASRPFPARPNNLLSSGRGMLGYAAALGRARVRGLISTLSPYFLDLAIVVGVNRQEAVRTIKPSRALAELIAIEVEVDARVSKL